MKTADSLIDAAQDIKERIDGDIIANIISTLPEDWLLEESMDLSVDEKREAYIHFLNYKLSRITQIAKDIIDGR
jgi:hypothetical protein